MFNYLGVYIVYSSLSRVCKKNVFIQKKFFEYNLKVAPFGNGLFNERAFGCLEKWWTVNTRGSILFICSK